MVAEEAQAAEEEITAAEEAIAAGWAKTKAAAEAKAKEEAKVREEALAAAEEALATAETKAKAAAKELAAAEAKAAAEEATAAEQAKKDVEQASVQVEEKIGDLFRMLKTVKNKSKVGSKSFADQLDESRRRLSQRTDVQGAAQAEHDGWLPGGAHLPGRKKQTKESNCSSESARRSFAAEEVASGAVCCQTDRCRVVLQVVL